MAAALGRKLVIRWTPLLRTALRRYFGTWSPRYHPARVDVPEGLDALLVRYSAQAAREIG